MKIPWIIALPLIAVSTGVTAHFWGPRSAVSVLLSMLLGWWIAYTYSGSSMDRAYNEYLYFDEEMKKEFMDRASPEMRTEIERRLKAEKEPNQAPEPTAPSGRGSS